LGSDEGHVMEDFKGRIAVITGAASGFGLEASRIAARGHEVVMADVQADALVLAATTCERSVPPMAPRCWRTDSTSRRPPRWRRWRPPRARASVCRTSSSTTPVWAPAA
jgi:NAD(P)-dependent dehydrogenase (short-subunit alcohol dehydrogenase family)